MEPVIHISLKSPNDRSQRISKIQFQIPGETSTVRHSPLTVREGVEEMRQKHTSNLRPWADFCEQDWEDHTNITPGCKPIGVHSPYK